MHASLSRQFLAEDYTLVDVLYYVTRDDLKCLRLRYCLLPLTFGYHKGKTLSLQQEVWVLALGWVCNQGCLHQGLGLVLNPHTKLN